MNQLTPEQHKRRAQMLRTHYDDQVETHDYRSPREWNRQAFRLTVKTTFFHIALKAIGAIGFALLILLIIKYRNAPPTWLIDFLNIKK